MILNWILLVLINGMLQNLCGIKRMMGGGCLLVVFVLLLQIFRTFFHSRLHVALDQYKNDPNFNGDIILIEPKDDDKVFFDMNPLIFSNRIRAACLGFESVAASIAEHYDDVAKVLSAYGIKMARKKVSCERESLTYAGDDTEKLRGILEK